MKLNQICTNYLPKLISLYIAQRHFLYMLYPSLYFRASFTSIKGVPRKKLFITFVNNVHSNVLTFTVNYVLSSLDSRYSSRYISISIF